MYELFISLPTYEHDFVCSALRYLFPLVNGEGYDKLPAIKQADHFKEVAVALIKLQGMLNHTYGTVTVANQESGEIEYSIALVLTEDSE